MGTWIETVRRLGRLAVSGLLALGLADADAAGRVAQAGGAVLGGVMGVWEIWRFVADTWPKIRGQRQDKERE